MKNKNKIYIIILIFTLLVLFLIVFLIWPLLREIKRNSEDLISAKNNIVNLEVQINETNNFKKNYETYKFDLNKIDQLFIDPSNPVNLIEFLENTASNSGITSQISLMPYASSSSKQFILLQFISNGGFSDTLSFLKKIESGPYLIEIENLDIQDSTKKLQELTDRRSGTPEENSSRYVEATLTIKIYIKK
jgi:Tfp pilus assembly protein PilO